MKSDRPLRRLNYNLLHPDEVPVLRDIATQLGFRPEQIEGNREGGRERAVDNIGNGHTFDLLDDRICRNLAVIVSDDSSDPSTFVRVVALRLVSISLAAFSVPESISKFPRLEDLGLQYGKVKPFLPATLSRLETKLDIQYLFYPPEDPKMANTEPSFSAATVNDQNTGNDIHWGSSQASGIVRRKDIFPNINNIWMFGEPHSHTSSDRYFRQLINYTLERCPNINSVGIFDNHFLATSFISLLDDKTKAPLIASHCSTKESGDESTRSTGGQKIAKCCNWYSDSSATTKYLQRLEFLRFKSCAINEQTLERLLWKIIPRGRRNGQSVDLQHLHCLEVDGNTSIQSFPKIVSRLNDGKMTRVVLRGNDNFPDDKRSIMAFNLWNTPSFDEIMKRGDQEEINGLLRILKATSAVSLAPAKEDIHTTKIVAYPPKIETRIRLNMAKIQVRELMKGKEIWKTRFRDNPSEESRVIAPYSIPAILHTIYDRSSDRYGHDPRFGKKNSTALYLFLRHNFKAIVPSSSKTTDGNYARPPPVLLDRRKKKRMKMSMVTDSSETCVIS